MLKQVISFHYTLTDKEGRAIDSSLGREPLQFMEGAGQIIPGLENEILKLSNGDKKKITVRSAEAYGDRSESLCVKVAREKLPTQEVKIGDMFRGGPEPHSPIFTVTALSDAEVTLDGNHPLAGADLTFDIEVTEMRLATVEEVEHGHAHGANGHSH